jgi:hypothetical protein
MSESQSVTLQCCACGRTFQKPRSTLKTQSLAACPHCAMLQAPRQAHDVATILPLTGMLRPTGRK